MRTDRHKRTPAAVGRGQPRQRRSRFSHAPCSGATTLRRVAAAVASQWPPPRCRAPPPIEPAPPRMRPRGHAAGSRRQGRSPRLPPCRPSSLPIPPGRAVAAPCLRRRYGGFRRVVRANCGDGSGQGARLRGRRAAGVFPLWLDVAPFSSPSPPPLLLFTGQPAGLYPFLRCSALPSPPPLPPPFANSLLCRRRGPLRLQLLRCTAGAS